ncbi:MAG: polysaccharide deacetylase family protein [Candidatus Nanopelagicales bacterium]
MSRSRRPGPVLALLAALPLLLTACASGTAQESATRSGQDARAAATPSAPRTATASPDESPSASPSVTVDPDAKVIYLTFDDGPWVPYTQQILDVLAKYDAQATFFMVGEMAAQHKALIRKVHDAGHAIGNHTWDHSNLTTLSDAEILSQMQRTQRVLDSTAAGPVMGACMRPPYGATNDHIRALLAKAGYHTYLWDFWAEDWNQPPIPQFLDSLETATKDGSNILLHDGGGDRPNTVEAVRIMLPRWIKKGYTFRALPACAKPFAGG